MSKSTSKREAGYDRVDRLAERADQVLGKVTNLDESVEEYTQRELEYLDRYKELTGDAMDDEEIYDIIIRYNFDDVKIEREINELIKLVKKKGEEYGWTKIENGKSK
jgi:cytidylate kinase